MKYTKDKLRGLLLLFMLIITSVSFSQININSITTGYYSCYKDGVKIDQHTQLQKVVTHCATIKANAPDSRVWYEYPLQTRIEVTGYKVKEIDTVLVQRRMDTDGKFIQAVIDNVHGDVLMAFHSLGYIKFKSDSINGWQYNYRLKRTKTFGNVEYENLDIPFQFVDAWSEGTMLHFTVTEKQVRITSWIDDVKFKEFLPGQSFKIDNGWTFEFGVPKTGHFKMEVENEDGDVIVYEIDLKL